MIRAQHPVARATLVAIGGVLVLASPLVGILPGPGGIFVFAGGLSLLLRNSVAVRRWVVQAMRGRPRLTTVVDRALRRPSARRRRERARLIAGEPVASPTIAAD